MIGLYIGIAIILFVLFLCLRALMFTDKSKKEIKLENHSSDDAIVNELCSLLKSKTISTKDNKETDYLVFQEYIEKVKNMFPLVFEKCEFKQTEDYAIYLKLKGKDSKSPSVLMAHYDVVPVSQGWDYDPFLGEVVDGYVYGRGAIDTKCTMVCALHALEKALKNNYIPNQDLYLCFGSDEEVFGVSQVKIVDELRSKGITPSLVFDEGGGIVRNVFPGVEGDIALLSVCEKGMANIKLSIDGNGGHSSFPKKNSPIIQLSKALLKLEKHPMKPSYTKTIRKMLDVLGRKSNFIMKIMLANMWLFKGLLKKIFVSVSPDFRALLSTTFAFTVIQGGTATNVIPNHVETNINVRIAPFNTIDEIVKHIRKTIKNNNIKIEVSNVNKMYKECDYNLEGYKKIRDTVYKTYGDVTVAPFISTGGTDGRHYNEISDCVIRFSPIVLSNEDRLGIHGINEKIKIKNLKKCLEFYENLLEIL